jgi:hypothetical protein
MILKKKTFKCTILVEIKTARLLFAFYNEHLLRIIILVTYSKFADLCVNIIYFMDKVHIALIQDFLL